MRGKKLRFEIELSFEEGILMRSLETSGVPRQLFILGMMHSQLIQQTSTPLEDVFGKCPSKMILCYGEACGRHYIDIEVPCHMAAVIQQLRGCSQVRG